MDNEIEILKSRTLVESTVGNWISGLSFVKGNIVDQEMYRDAPIEVDIINNMDVL
jgi:hypothetical protein